MDCTMYIIEPYSVHNRAINLGSSTLIPKLSGKLLCLTLDFTNYSSSDTTPNRTLKLYFKGTCQTFDDVE